MLEVKLLWQSEDDADKVAVYEVMLNPYNIISIDKNNSSVEDDIYRSRVYYDNNGEETLFYVADEFEDLKERLKDLRRHKLSVLERDLSNLIQEFKAELRRTEGVATGDERMDSNAEGYAGALEYVINELELLIEY